MSSRQIVISRGLNLHNHVALQRKRGPYALLAIDDSGWAWGSQRTVCLRAFFLPGSDWRPSANLHWRVRPSTMGESKEEPAPGWKAKPSGPLVSCVTLGQSRLLEPQLSNSCLHLSNMFILPSLITSGGKCPSPEIK